MDPFRFSNPHACDAPMAVGKQVRFQVDDQHHAHGCVEKIVHGGAWVKLDNGEKLFVKKRELRVENPSTPKRLPAGYKLFKHIPGEGNYYTLRGFDGYVFTWRGLANLVRGSDEVFAQAQTREGQTYGHRVSGDSESAALVAAKRDLRSLGVR